MRDAAAARSQMVDSQIKPNKVNDRRVIEAMASVPREHFVPKRLKGVAYLDEDLEIAPGRYLMEPMVLARLAEAASISADEAILDVGCGAGYTSAVLAQLGAAVVALEEDHELAEKATRKLAEIEADNVAVVEGSLAEGVADQGPFDVIFLAGAAEVVPDKLLDQLAEGGRMVYVSAGPGCGRGRLITRIGGILGTRDLFDAGTPLLPGFSRNPEFDF